MKILKGYRLLFPNEYIISGDLAFSPLNDDSAWKGNWVKAFSLVGKKVCDTSYLYIRKIGIKIKPNTFGKFRFPNKKEYELNRFETARGMMRENRHFAKQAGLLK